MNKLNPNREYIEVFSRTGVVSGIETDATEGVDKEDRLFWFIAPSASASHPPDTLHECTDAYLDIAVDGPEDAIRDDDNYLPIVELPTEERRRLRIGSIMHHHTYQPLELLPGEDPYGNHDVDVYCISPHTIREDEFDDFKRKSAKTLMPVLEAQSEKLKAIEDERIARMPKVKIEQSFKPFSLTPNQINKWNDSISAPLHVFEYGQAEHDGPVFVKVAISYRAPRESRSESYGFREAVEITPLSPADSPHDPWKSQGSLQIYLGDDRYTPEELSNLSLYLKVVVDGQQYIAIPDKEHDDTSQGCFSIAFNRFYPVTLNMRGQEIQALISSGNSCVLIFPLEAIDDPRVTNIELTIGAELNFSNQKSSQSGFGEEIY